VLPPPSKVAPVELVIATVPDIVNDAVNVRSLLISMLPPSTFDVCNPLKVVTIVVARV
jgi:hypothetical protein